MKRQRKDVKLKSVTINADKHTGQQMKLFRDVLNISIEDLAKRVRCNRTNITNFESELNQTKRRYCVSRFLCKSARYKRNKNHSLNILVWKHIKHRTK